MTSFPLPPLTALRVFEAAARHGSFTRAGQELGMTQAAVSYQIKVIEERVGTPLFVRRPRQVTLTETGQRFAPLVTDAFERIASAYAEARGAMEGTFTISTAQTFAINWLVQNLDAFQALHPALTVRLEASQRLAAFQTEDVDVAIRSGHGPWPGLERHLLLMANFSPMLSPRLAETVGGIRTPEDLLRLPLLDPDDSWWQAWFGPIGIAIGQRDGNLSPKLGAQSMVARAAIAGRGVAMLTPALYRLEIEHGLLIQPFERIETDGLGYWLVYPEGRRNAPKIRAFREWLLKAVAAECGTPPDG
ncbi:LysR substrate-binding domain-containing protein [Nitratireductor sp. ZSWI3]|uniref:LysR substrate-binding domain-containing protein n=1 Tax=Nitratireductor sp. ZSWI3 TaxID=2966359 RepID=UPI00214FE366|nr:LysR substrate-binding domain-containing protein [Nitratireductor sp. ZSWI3]MCR4268978.1 LysR substrate-binding domain-containing protein [Nitratireductor sp. ZSWI3]